MRYKSLKHCAEDLLRNGGLIVIDEEVDPNLVMADIHRRVFDAGGPALLFTRVKGSEFPALSNLYGTFERTEFLFRSTLENVRKVVSLKTDPTVALKNPLKHAGAAFTAFTGLPKKVRFRRSHFRKTTISRLPQIVSWPDDGGAFVTLPQVLTRAPGDQSIMRSNLGMYRVQLSGNDYEPDREIGMHYQLHRGIGVHHSAYNRLDQPFRATVFVGGLPSHALAAIMPLPEGLSELTFAGMLAGRRFRYAEHEGHILSLDADFCITGTILKNVKKPEGPFGDHLGYYSLQHDFPVMQVENVYHKPGSIWHFTVVGRPPQEDSSFGHLIHMLVAPALADEFPGLRSLNAVDAAGVHPLLLAVGSERYMPFREKVPEEILTQANHLLGKGQTSLAKYLFIADGSDDPGLNADRIEDYFHHVLSRIDLSRDLHFQTKTTMDTLDYSGSGWNAGSKLVIACCGEPLREPGTEVPGDMASDPFADIALPLPGILAISGEQYTSAEAAKREMASLRGALERTDLSAFPIIVVCDDAQFCARTLNNFLWVTFTRSNPATDIYGVGEFVENKHWGCRGPMIIDARVKPHHAPQLVRDRSAVEKADSIISKVPALKKLGI